MNRLIFWLLILMVVSAIGANFYTFYFKKNIDFIIETPCDENTQTCFVRDCSTGDCPPNNLSQYRSFHISASNYAACEYDSCVKDCSSGSVKCVELMCDESGDDACSNKTEI